MEMEEESEGDQDNNTNNYHECKYKTLYLFLLDELQIVRKGI